MPALVPSYPPLPPPHSPLPTSPSSLSRRASSTNPSLLFDVPASLSTFLSQLGTEGSLSCEKGGGVGLDTRSGGYHTNGKGKSGTRYCGDKKEAPKMVWWQSNMDVDCDGSNKKGPCSNDGSFQGQTAFQDKSGKDIDAHYVVIDQDKDFDPTKFGIEPLSVVAVVCGGKLTFGIWADTNAQGDMGEVSVYLAQVCFGTGMNGDAGYDNPDVLYVAFPGEKSETVPSREGKDLNEIMTIGQGLVQKVFGGGGAVDSGGAGSLTGVSGASHSGGRAGSTGGGGGKLSDQATASSAGLSGGNLGATGSGGATEAAPIPTGNSAATASSASEGAFGGLSTSGGTAGGSTPPGGSSSALLGSTGMLGGNAAWPARQTIRAREQERRNKRQRVRWGVCAAVEAYESKKPE
ncbi:Endo-chitosanase [Rhodotorula toruloides]|uniref:Endo-chitosanase n=1 Tax=Rhodotorula toruloides TaxID=5286 RepID=A0A2S9ZY85_RHOTO|nr:Endo-chitosanase [Rhodotorula toruloides]PRQ70739.1 Fungal chitosanase of glycosyl hydrolase group 75-domain containing protein [Rhodotorula toruloides]